MYCADYYLDQNNISILDLLCTVFYATVSYMPTIYKKVYYKISNIDDINQCTVQISSY